VREFTSWRGLLSLSLGLVLAPVVVLVNEEVIYASDMWACGHRVGGVLHIIPVLSLIIVVGALIGAYLNWRASGRGVEVEHGDVVTRTRFLALLGLAIGTLSALVVIAQWFGIFMFAPCMRA
jgi:hypothetical protein